MQEKNGLGPHFFAWTRQPRGSRRLPPGVAVNSGTAALHLALLGIASAMNFFDGVDDLATGHSISPAGFPGFVAALTVQPFMGWRPARGWLPGISAVQLPPQAARGDLPGDAGSTFPGLVPASPAVEGAWAENGIIHIAVPVPILWIFIFDLTHIAAGRIATGGVRSFQVGISCVGKDHLHHRPEGLLGSRRKTVFLIFSLPLAMGLAATALRNAQNLEAVLSILQAAIILVIVSIPERAGDPLGGRGDPEEALPRSGPRGGKRGSVADRLAEGRAGEPGAIFMACGDRSRS